MQQTQAISAHDDPHDPRREQFSSWKFWLIALLLHALILILFGTLYVTVIKPQQALQSKNYSGVEVAAPMAPPVPAEALQQADQIAPEKPLVDWKQIQPMMTAPQPSMPVATSQPMAAPLLPNALPGQMIQANVPQAWAKRMAGNKRAFVPDPAIEDAVMRALRWLKSNQNPADGSWGNAYPTSMTGMALLTFLAHGETPQSREFGETVRAGINFLLPQAQRGRMGSTVHYEHGIATYALAEAYGMTKDPALKEPLERCVQTIINAQAAGHGGGGGGLLGLLRAPANGPGGGWMYNYADAPYGDMSISGWHVQALKAAYLAGVMQDKIPATLDRAMVYAKSVYNAQARGFGYQGPNQHTAILPSRDAQDPIWSLTGTGVLCLQFWNEANSPEAKQAIDHLRADLLFDPPGNAQNRNNRFHLYGYYYATQALFLADGPRGPGWTKWDGLFRKKLILSQNHDGSFPAQSWVGKQEDGLVFGTTLSTLMLEVWYRNDAQGLNITVLKPGH